MNKNEIINWTDYVSLGLYAFLGLGMELVLVIIESFIFKANVAEYATIQLIVHWIITIVIWGVFTYFITKAAREKYNFDYFQYKEKMTKRQCFLASILLLLVLAVSIWDWKGFKVLKEFQNLGLLKFSFQYLYYLMETVLITLIVVFGQKAGEVKYNKLNVPWGGIMVGLTWGSFICLPKAVFLLVYLVYS